MRHRIKAVKLNRNQAQRKALLRGLAQQVLIHGQITTTKAKAKAVKPIIDRLIAKAKQTNTVHQQRLARQFLVKQDLVNKLFNQIAPRYQRSSGFSRIVPLKYRRGDNSLIVKLELLPSDQDKKTN